jgi:zinc protease
MLAPRGSTLIVVGAVDPNELIARLEENLLAWKGEAPPRTPRPESTVKPKPGTVYLVDKPGAVQSVLRIGRIWQGRDDPRYFATLLGNRILGGDFLSRLNQNLRERNGFTYGAGSLFSYRRTGSVWIVNTSVRSDATAPALLEVFRELDGLVADRPFLDEEIAAARYSELQEFPERFESPGSILGVLREMVDYRLPDDYLKTYLKKLEDVEPSEVRRSMREVARLSERVVLIVGDRQSAESKLRALPGVTTIVLTSPDGVPLGP